MGSITTQEDQGEDEPPAEPIVSANGQDSLGIPGCKGQRAHRTSSISTVYSDDGRESLLNHRQVSASPEPLEPRTPLTRRPPWRVRVRRFAADNEGVALMVLAQFFTAGMSTIARLLEIHDGQGPAMHPFQVGHVYAL